MIPKPFVIPIMLVKPKQVAIPKKLATQGKLTIPIQIMIPAIKNLPGSKLTRKPSKLLKKGSKGPRKSYLVPGPNQSTRRTKPHPKRQRVPSKRRNFVYLPLAKHPFGVLLG